MSTRCLALALCCAATLACGEEPEQAEPDLFAVALSLAKEAPAGEARAMALSQLAWTAARAERVEVAKAALAAGERALDASQPKQGGEDFVVLAEAYLGAAYLRTGQSKAARAHFAGALGYLQGVEWGGNQLDLILDLLARSGGPKQSWKQELVQLALKKATTLETQERPWAFYTAAAPLRDLGGTDSARALGVRWVHDGGLELDDLEVLVEGLLELGGAPLGPEVREPLWRALIESHSLVLKRLDGTAVAGGLEGDAERASELATELVKAVSEKRRRQVGQLAHGGVLIYLAAQEGAKPEHLKRVRVTLDRFWSPARGGAVLPPPWPLYGNVLRAVPALCEPAEALQVFVQERARVLEQLKPEERSGALRDVANALASLGDIEPAGEAAGVIVDDLLELHREASGDRQRALSTLPALRESLEALGAVGHASGVKPLRRAVGHLRARLRHEWRHPRGGNRESDLALKLEGLCAAAGALGRLGQSAEGAGVLLEVIASEEAGQSLARDEFQPVFWACRELEPEARERVLREVLRRWAALESEEVFAWEQIFAGFDVCFE